MTVIAWDGYTMAGDKRTSFGGLHATSTKVHLIGDKLVGCAGNTAQIYEMLEWLRFGANPEKLPATQRNGLDCVSMLVVDGDRLLQYENGPCPIVLENRFWAIGSGRDFAMTAMHFGKTATEAVEVACLFDSSCGNGIDSLSQTRQKAQESRADTGRVSGIGQKWPS